LIPLAISKFLKMWFLLLRPPFCARVNHLVRNGRVWQAFQTTLKKAGPKITWKLGMEENSVKEPIV
jgi:hypothetical protein